MKKLSFLILLTLSCTAVFAQWSVSGNVIDVNSQAVINKMVYVSTDSIPNYPGFWGQDVTDSNGNYAISFVSGTPGMGQTVHIMLYDCNNAMVDDTVTYMGNNIIHDFIICAAAPPPPTSIEGTITAANPVIGEPNADVYLIAMAVDSMTQDTTLTAIDSTVTDSIGYYSFAIPNMFGVDLLVKAALRPSNVNYSSYLPTYYTSSIVWSGATGLPDPLPNNGINIQLIVGINPGGPGFIGGSVSQGANKSTAVGDPLEHRILILTNLVNQPIAYTYSDALGNFNFSNLPLGSYKLFGDVMGKYNPALPVTLDATNQSVVNIEFQEHSQVFEGHFIIAASVGNTGSALSNASVFPNPATDNINVIGLDKLTGTRTVTLTCINGSVVYKHDFNEKDTISVPLAALSKGIYILHVNTLEGSLVFKVAK